MQAWNWASQLGLPLLAMRQLLWAARQAATQELPSALAQEVVASVKANAKPVRPAMQAMPAIIRNERLRMAHSLLLEPHKASSGWTNDRRARLVRRTWAYLGPDA
jgi:hypothetical protein